MKALLKEHGSRFCIANLPETGTTVLLGMGIVPEKVHHLLHFTRSFNNACQLFSFIFFIFLFLVGIYNSKAKNMNKKNMRHFSKTGTKLHIVVSV